MTLIYKKLPNLLILRYFQKLFLLHCIEFFDVSSKCLKKSLPLSLMLVVADNIENLIWITTQVDPVLTENF